MNDVTVVTIHYTLQPSGKDRKTTFAGGVGIGAQIDRWKEAMRKQYGDSFRIVEPIQQEGD